jgi:hypothetical protein
MEIEIWHIWVIAGLVLLMVEIFFQSQLTMGLFMQVGKLTKQFTNILNQHHLQII